MKPEIQSRNTKEQLSFIPYVMRGILRSDRGGGPIDYFREKKLRKIAAGQNTRVQDISKVIFNILYPKKSKNISEFLGKIFDKEYPSEKIKEAKEILKTEYNVGVRRRIGQEQQEPELSKKISRLNRIVIEIKNDMQSDSIRAASANKNILQSLTMVNELMTRSIETIDANRLYTRISDLEKKQDEILQILQQRASSEGESATATRVKSNRLSFFDPPTALNTEELVKIVETNTLEDVRKILVERRPDRENELNQILNAISNQKSINDIEEDELQEILTKALVKALRESNFASGGSSTVTAAILAGISGISAAVATLSGLTAKIMPFLKNIVPSLARMVPGAGALAAPGALAATAVGAPAAAGYMASGKSAENVIEKQNQKIADYGLKILGKNKQGVAIYEADGKKYTVDNLPKKYKDVVEAYVGDTRSYSAKEAQKRVEQNLSLYSPKAPSISPAAPAPVQEETRTLIEKQAENISQPTTGTQPVVNNVYNNVVNNIPQKQKMQVSNNENTFSRLLQQDLDFPQTYGNLNMG